MLFNHTLKERGLRGPCGPQDIDFPAWLLPIEGDIMYRIIVSVLFVWVILPVHAQRAEVMMLGNGQISLPESFETPPLEKPDEKNPWIAFLLSTAIPGGGQFYNQQFFKGATMFLGTAAGVGLFYATRNDNYTNKLTGKYLDPDDNDGKGYLGLGLGLGFVAWSMIDAPVSANRINERNRQAVRIGPMIDRDKAGIVLSLQFD